MTFTEIMHHLDKLSVYERTLIGHKCRQLNNDESNIESIRNNLHPGMQITYFNSQLNKEVSAIVENIKKTKVTVIDCDSPQRWDIRFGSINTQNIKVSTLKNSSNTLSRSNLSIGETVGFMHNNAEQIGKVVKLNQKTACVRLACGQVWKVYYMHLFPVINGECNHKNEFTIEGEVEYSDPS